MKNTKTLKIVQTGIFLALLIVFQVTTKSLGQLVTGSLVNFTLIGSVLAVGLWGGLAVAIVSPVLASLLGIGPAFVQLVPMIMLGNAVIVVVYFVILQKAKTSSKDKDLLVWVAAIVAGAVAKFVTLYFGMVKLVIPTITFPKPAMAQKLAATFGLPQLVTALIGGALAMVVIPPVLKAINKNKE
ncbi:MAG: ECF transporter S component [Oscillospiraceae bacterium]